MPDDSTRYDPSENLDTLEIELNNADPADAPAIAEELAEALGDALEATQVAPSDTGATERTEGDGP
jgi:hypothetical protein